MCVLTLSTPKFVCALVASSSFRRLNNEERCQRYKRPTCRVILGRHNRPRMIENKMDNAGFERENSTTSVPVDIVEEGAMSPIAVATVNATPVNGNTPAQCSEMCQSLHLQHQNHYPEKKPAAPPESPWHRLKTIFLIGIIIFLVLWIFVYTLLSQFHLL